MRKIELPVLGLAVLFDDERGTVASDMHKDYESVERRAAIETMEAIVLGHAMKGVDVQSAAYGKGLEMAFNAVVAALNAPKKKRNRSRRGKNKTKNPQ